ncbi:4-hydroxythreonine-4-phosphate dehydrogenase PdxA [Roseibacterium sp. SDUM158017]|uniref:4-hydroxythreonine-4-phosphate dehydrogenase PdxA n=1 Tax=Roseicyclus salinarum TaxID=3036773 RepID=UPI00241565C4|nr:4-hydroxythreonine-4-phosphate dehydrogenase PdxA [Roseibacterium sp. SDUM158017]MDG4648472.1 4-hydroxythreonine-4-phosphate dehydrogenase PdxA [Roseibacterium sp. SDUM158017]
MSHGPAPVALTVGEPAGIGPELAAMAWSRLAGRVPFFVIGDPDHFAGLGVPVRTISAPAETGRALASGLPVLAHPFSAPATPGRPAPENAQAVISAIARGVHLVMSGEASALTTGPIHKKALIDGAGFAYPGHTEYLAHLAGVERVVMMLAGPDLKVVPATIHIPLADVPGAIDRALLSDTIRITDAGLRRDFGIKSPRIAVAGLNPHAGEGGAIGREEIETIAPVIEALRAEGLAVTGPHSADTMFHKAARSRFDAAVTMYHDQALIPIKTLAFDEGVNVTLGLPFVRTSPDHGTAFDIAGTGRANPSSLIEALLLAERMAATRASGVRA